MNTHLSKIVEGGRIVIPAKLRQELGVTRGDTVLLKMVDGELHVQNQKRALTRIQDRLRALNKDMPSPVDELIAERRADAAGHSGT